MLRITALSFLVLGVISLFASGARAEIKTKRIEYTVNNQTYEGFLAFDDAVKDKRPGVLVCHEWWGMNDYAESRAKQLAAQGYTAFALDMYGKGKTTSDPKQAGEWSGKMYADPKAARALAAAGLKVLADDPHADASHLAAIGYCMGGTVALELARSGLAHTADLKAIVCFHTSSLAAKDPSDNANIKGSVLICHGAADTFTKPEELASLQRQMADAKIDYQVITYAGAFHSFTNPNADKYGIDGIKYNAKADARSWRAMLDLFHEGLNPSGAPKGK
jgi:dienelactone hydrolase